MVKIKRSFVSNLIRILDTFNKAFGLIINQAKSRVCWVDKQGLLPAQTHEYEWIWIEEGNIAKLLDILFGMDISILHVDDFLLNCIHKELTYQNIAKLFLAERQLITNQVLLLILWYSIGIWMDSKKVITKIKGFLKNYLQAGYKHKTCTRVAQNTCIHNKSLERLSFINPNDTINALHNKWIICACELGDSNLNFF